MSDVIRWGVLGAANFALTTMAPAIHNAKNAVLAAVATRDPGKAAPFAALAPGLRVHESYGAALADPDIDAIYIPLPNSLHVDCAEKAAKAGKHVKNAKVKTGPTLNGNSILVPLYNNVFTYCTSIQN